MSETAAVAVVVATIAALPGCLAAVAAILANRNAKRARYQVENDHDTNLRVENDERHRSVIGWLKRLDRSVGGVRDDFRALADRVHDLEQLEMTNPRERGKQ